MDDEKSYEKKVRTYTYTYTLTYIYMNYLHRINAILPRLPFIVFIQGSLTGSPWFHTPSQMVMGVASPRYLFTLPHPLGVSLRQSPLYSIQMPPLSVPKSSQHVRKIPKPVRLPYLSREPLQTLPLAQIVRFVHVKCLVIVAIVDAFVGFCLELLYNTALQTISIFRLWKLRKL